MRAALRKIIRAAHRRPVFTGFAGSLAVLLLAMAGIGAMTITQYPYGISTPYVYTYDQTNMWAGIHYAAMPSLSANDTFAMTGTAQTLTYKTLTSPVIASLYQDAGKTKLITFPAASITVPGTVIQGCGTAAACNATNVSSTAKIIFGRAPLVSTAVASPVTITGMPAFTSSSSYVCTATDVTSASPLQVTYNSSSSITITGPASVSDTVAYQCVGN